MGVIAEGTFLISGIIGYYRYYIKKQKNQKSIEQGI
jgi:hypothetical protein